MVRQAIYIILLVGLFLGRQSFIAAQDDADAWTNGPLNMRTGPNQDFTVITELPPGTALVLDARNADATWVLGTTTNRQFRGWVARTYLGYRDQFHVIDLPVRDEILESTVPYNTVDLNAYPVLPESVESVRAIFEQSTRNSHIIAKVGDCNSIEWRFLHPFGLGEYDLGTYTELTEVIDHFEESLAYRSYASQNGLTVNGALDPAWASRSACLPDESPLACEFRLHNPSVAIIMFGTNDMIVLTPGQFDYYLRRLVHETINMDVIPILSTFPRHLAFPDRSITFNRIVVLVARDLDVPLVNLWRALEPLPNHGIADDGFHLSGTMQAAGVLTEENLHYGYTMRNLVTLQVLDRVWREAMND